MTPPLSNGEIAAQLMALAQLLAARGENKFKVKAYRRAARTLATLGDSIYDLAKANADLTVYPGIGSAISGTIHELVDTGTLRHLQTLRSEATPEMVEIAQYPRLDTRRVLRAYKKLGISSIPELKQKSESGEIALKLGAKVDQHIRQGLNEIHEFLLYEADKFVPTIKRFLIDECRVRRAEPVGSYRRRVEVVDEIAFLVETEDVSGILGKLERYGGKSEIRNATKAEAVLRLSSGTTLRIRASDRQTWGLNLILSTGSDEHLRRLPELPREGDGLSTEKGVYARIGLSFIPPELREGGNEIALAAEGAIPEMVQSEDIHGELHAHSTSSDGAHSIEDMAMAAKDHGYDYIGMSDHSQTLKIAHGLSEKALWNQIRFIDKLNLRLDGFRVLKSAEVDILADGSLDYPDDLLKELDYTVCSIHSRFGLGKADQTTRILRAMDNRYFNILGHATGRLLLKRPGYEIDVERVIEHARQNRCYFEINSSPDRLDFSAANARLAKQAGVKIAITTDAHSTHDFKYLRYGIDQARRAGLERESVLNHYPWPELQQMLKR